MNNLKVVYRDTDNSSGKWRRIAHATIIALLISLAVGVASMGAIEYIKYICNALTSLK